MVLVGQELGELRVEHAELVVPRVAHDPELEAAFVLMVPPAGAQRFKALDLGRETRSFGRATSRSRAQAQLVPPVRRYSPPPGSESVMTTKTPYRPAGPPLTSPPPRLGHEALTSECDCVQSPQANGPTR